MKRFTWSIGLAFLGVIATGGSACTVTVTSGDGGNPFDDGGGQDTATNLDSGTLLDTSTTPDTGTAADSSASPDTGQPPDTGTTTDGGEGGTCTILTQVTFGSAACDDCLGKSCCDSTTACFTGAENDCESKVTCFTDCLAGSPDAGIAPGDTATCKTQCAGFDAMASTFDTWVTCVSNYCSTSCQ
jgi:hypothetical protein